MGSTSRIIATTSSSHAVVSQSQGFYKFHNRGPARVRIDFNTGGSGNSVALTPGNSTDVMPDGNVSLLVASHPSLAPDIYEYALVEWERVG